MQYQHDGPSRPLSRAWWRFPSRWPWPCARGKIGLEHEGASQALASRAEGRPQTGLGEFPCVEIQAIALGKAWRRRSLDERVKPSIATQLVQVQPGQSRSGQAGSECCHSPGDWWVRSVHSEEAGREGSAPKAFVVAEADAVSLAEGSTRPTDSARSTGVAGVLSPGHVSTGVVQEPRRAPHLLGEIRVRHTRTKRAWPEAEGMHRQRERTNHPAAKVPGVRGRPEAPGTDGVAVL